LKRNGHEWRIRAMNDADLQLIHRYFLLSQFCDWNTPTMVNSFARETAAAARTAQTFPIDAIRRIAMEKNRTGDIHETQLMGQPWFTAKVLMPGRVYIFHESKPQVDHIFPMELEGTDDTYRTLVNVLWNFQPMPAEVNNYKRARHPFEFFSSEDGRKYYGAYDFLPALNSPLWEDHVAFIAGRRMKMLEELKSRYGVSVVPPAEAPATG